MPHAVEHIGSTSVPGMPAKPVIDLMVGVTDYEPFDEIRAALESVAYVWDPAAERDEPARKVFRKGPADPAAAAEYATVKADLLRTCGGDSRAYTRGKHEVVKKIERAAGVDVP